MSKGPIRFVFASDSHGDQADPEALDALFAFCKDYLRPGDIRIAGGDHFDLRSLRRGVGNDAESAESLRDDIEAGFDFLEKFRPDVYLMGNHEHRLNSIITSTGNAIFRDYCQDTLDAIHRQARRCGAKKILPYNAGEKGVYRLGPVAMIHGYAHSVNATAAQGLHYADRGGALIHGHTHNLAQVNLTKEGGGAAFSAGCLCLKNPSYASTRLATARWGSGFAAGWVDGKDWKIWLVHKLGEDRRWIWQTDLKVYTPKVRR